MAFGHDRAGQAGSELVVDLDRLPYVPIVPRWVLLTCSKNSRGQPLRAITNHWHTST
jgi:hypothetical protein